MALPAGVHAGPHCQDKGFHPPPPHGPCSADTNVHAHWHEHPCAIGVQCGGLRGVCGACHNDTVSRPWANTTRLAIGRINPPPQPPGGWPAGAPAAWTGFLTRLCKACEGAEQAKYHFYLNNQGTVTTMAARPAPALFAQMNWPVITCTCDWQLGRIGPVPALGPALDPRWCYDDVRARRDDLIQTRNLVDAWLRTAARDVNGRTCHVSGHRLNSRLSRRRASYRACRCGAEVDTTIANAEVWMCMACQGLWHVALPGTPISRYQPPFRDINKRAAAHTRSRGPTNIPRLKLPHKV